MDALKKAAGGVQAQTFHPNASAVLAEASNPTLDYEGTINSCDTGTAVGETGSDLDFVNLELDFVGNCGIAGLGVSVVCSEAIDDDENDGDKNPLGTARLQALDATTNEGTVDRLNEGFFCEFTRVGVCTITVAEQELPVAGGVSDANLVGEGTADPVLRVELDLTATRIGSSLCGPSRGVMGISAEYHLDPDEIAID